MAVCAGGMSARSAKRATVRCMCLALRYSAGSARVFITPVKAGRPQNEKIEQTGNIGPGGKRAGAGVPLVNANAPTGIANETRQIR